MKNQNCDAKRQRGISSADENTTVEFATINPVGDFLGYYCMYVSGSFHY